VADLKSSMQALAEVRPLQDGLEATESAVAAAKASLDKAVASIGAELQPAVQEITTAFDAVQTAVEGLTTDNVRDQAPVIATALRGLGTAVASLTTALSQECPQ
jgi:phage-related protein